MKVVVGLGNPGSRYQSTRHNVGFDLIDALAQTPGATAYRARFDCEIAELQEAGQQVLLAKPQTYMNLSGRAVRQIVDFFKLELADLLIVSDDMALPLGKLRAKAGGSHGGQNGLRSIQEALGTADYPRLRIGIGSAPAFVDAADFVLSRFKPGDKAVIDDAMIAAAQGVALWVREGTESLMNKINGEPKKPAPPKPKKTPPPPPTEPDPKGS